MVVLLTGFSGKSRKIFFLFSLFVDPRFQVIIQAMEEEHKCDLTGKPAKVFVTKVLGSSVYQAKYSLEAAVQLGVFNEQCYSLISDGEQDSPARQSRGLHCPNCGHSLRDFQKTGRLGCSKCWEIFSEQLGVVLKKMHRGGLHLGKCPKSNIAGPVVERRRDDLQNRLQEAVRREFYEEAADLRDELKQLGS